MKRLLFTIIIAATCFMANARTEFMYAAILNVSDNRYFIIYDDKEGTGHEAKDKEDNTLYFVSAPKAMEYIVSLGWKLHDITIPMAHDIWGRLDYFLFSREVED